MATIIPRKRRDGSTAFLAQISIKRSGKFIHREARTFERRPAAEAWVKKRKKELDAPGGIERAKLREPTLANAIDKYIAESAKEVGRTKAQVLRSLKSCDIAALACSEIKSQDIVSLARELSDGERTPQTVANYISHLAAIFAIARPAWGYELDQQAMRDAQVVTKRLGTTSKSRERDRRPTLDELDKLMDHFAERSRRRSYSVPMVRVMAFAIFSTRRQDEITRIRWEDFDAEGKRVLVRDMKNPGEKIGNDVWCDLPDPCVSIVEAMPRVAEEIFPFGTDAISASFTRACQFLGIENLHFHDLRHDGVSRLFELGKNIPHAAAVSGHRSWTSLKRYTHIRQAGDKYAGWKWLDVVTKP